jgi:hypothetical protein
MYVSNKTNMKTKNKKRIALLPQIIPKIHHSSVTCLSQIPQTDGTLAPDDLAVAGD